MKKTYKKVSVIALIFLVFGSSGILSVIGISNASSNNDAQLEYKRGVCENSSIFEPDAYEYSNIIQNNLKSKPSLSERFEMEGYYYINEIDLEAETFNKIENEYDATIDLVIDEFDIMELTISSRYVEGKYEFINQGSHEIIGKNDEIYYFYDCVLPEPIGNLVQANLRYVIYRDNSQFSIAGRTTEDIQFSFQGVIDKGYVNGNSLLTTYYESLESKENIISQSSSEYKATYREHYEQPRVIFSIKDFENIYNIMNLTGEKRELADKRLADMRSDLEKISQSSPDGRYSNIKDQNEDLNSPNSAGILGERYVVIAECLSTYGYHLSILTRAFITGVVGLWDAVDTQHVHYLLTPTKDELVDEIKYCTDQSSWIWIFDHFLIFNLISCHSRSSDSAWGFVKNNPLYYVYASDITGIWDNHHSPKWTNVITFSCYSASSSQMRYAWIHADWYDADYNASLFSGSRCTMVNTYFTSTGMSIIWDLLLLIIPTSTVDLWFLSIFFDYNFVLGISMVIPIQFGCTVYDIQMITRNIVATPLDGTGYYRTYTATGTYY